ncbi:MAG: TonB-dependent receptor [Bacteroidales bacterium]|nr:TonB-dependent receptor [Bacteroidales bacterium]
MKYTKSFFLLLAVLLFANSGVYSQSRNHRVKGELIDSVRNERVEFATAALIPKGEEQPLKYALSNSQGAFEITDVPSGEYKLRIEFMGYNTVEKDVVVRDSRIVDVGMVNMLEQVNLLDQVVVSALGNPVIVKKDTIEYNATSFKSTDSDMLEELLKKLPGIEIDSDGKITANGKEITKIMVDGKTFFLDDPSLATKNLPAKIIDKVRVVERQSEQARFTGIDDGNEETVIDLSIRPGMMNGWFGNATAGYGTDDRFQGAAMVGNFREDSQISMIANGNNTNNRAFSDMAGSMMRSMRSSMGGSRGGIRVGGTTMNFGGNGITTSWMGGLNANTELNDGKFKIGGNYFYGKTDNVAESITSRQNFLQDSSFFNRDSTVSKNISDGHRVALELEWELSEKTSILFRPNVSIGFGSFSEQNSYSTSGANGTKINDGNSISAGDNESQSLGGDLLFRHRLGKPGRTFSVNFTYSYSNNVLDGLNRSETNRYGATQMSDIVDQRFDLTSNSYSLGARASYTEPLGKNYFLELAYRYNTNVSNSEKYSYNFNTVTQSYDILDQEYSNTYENTFVNQQAEVNVRKNEDKYSYTLGFNVQPSSTESIGDTTYLKRDIVNFSPSAQFDYRFSEMKSIRVRYRGNTNQPSINQLQPVPDNSNPLYIPLGNPDLLPEFNHRLWVDFRSTQKETFRSLNLRLGANYTMDKIVNMTWYDEGGIQYSKPVNEDGVHSVFSNLMFNTPIRKSKFYFMSGTRLSLNNGINYSNQIRNKTTSLSLGEYIRLSYRGDKLEASVGGRANYSHAWYTIENNIRPATWNNSVSMYLNWTMPGGFNLKSDIDHNFYIGYEEGMNEPTTVWNAEFSKQVLKNMGTLGLKVYDILNQSRNVWRNTNDNYIEDIQNNTLRQYFMLSFTIRFGTFGGGDSNRRGPGSGMGGHRRF